MIEYSKIVAKEKESKIKFIVSDATNIEVYENDSFDYLIYLQQVLCFINKEDLFINALKEICISVNTNN
tara:strand:+ start:503 stop:709 length:207 start_codon:yes stop_codon:yes gene_type:complete